MSPRQCEQLLKGKVVSTSRGRLVFGPGRKTGLAEGKTICILSIVCRRWVAQEGRKNAKYDWAGRECRRRDCIKTLKTPSSRMAPKRPSEGIWPKEELIRKQTFREDQGKK